VKALIVEKFIATRLLNLALSKSTGQGPQVQDVPIPGISENEILVEIRAVVLNQIDNKFAETLSSCGSRLGSDFAGVVSKVGPKAAGTCNTGERVAGMVYGEIYNDRGTFAEYFKTDADLVWRVPDKVSDNETSTFGVTAVTAMLALNFYLDVAWPDNTFKRGTVHNSVQKTKELLIYSGATGVGLFTIQLAK
jgi:NADPH:quinone reductase-like Zn-dependent oxidoreductase